MPTIDELQQAHDRAWTALVYALHRVIRPGMVVRFRLLAPTFGPKEIEGRVIEIVTEIEVETAQRRRRRVPTWPHWRMVDDLTGQEYIVTVNQLDPALLAERGAAMGDLGADPVP